MRDRRRRVWRLLALPLLGGLAGCFSLSSSAGGGQDVNFSGTRAVNPADVALPPGYKISAVAVGLSFPTGVCLDGGGNIFLIESGGASRLPRLLRVNADGSTTAIATGEGAPWNGVAFHDGNFYVSASGAGGNGRILRITPGGAVTPLVENLPSLGESQTTGPVISNDGYVYFGQSAATNSGIVSPDAPARSRRFHDIPGGDIKLAGMNVASADPVNGGDAVTGAYSPFGDPTAPGQIVPAQIPCTAGVMRVPLAGGPPELVAWGLRDPFGLAFAPDGQLFVSDRMYEDRGSRPVSGCGDLLWAIKSGVWYGWPDFYGPIPLNSSRQFAAVAKPPPQPLLAEYPNTPPDPTATFGMHAGAGGLDFCRGGAFGFSGEVFLAEFGDTAPYAGKLLAPVGFDVVRVDLATGVSHVFAANKGDATGPASKINRAGLERPIAVKFDPAGTALYVVDYGVVTVAQTPQPRAGTGVLWKITPEASR